MEWKKFLDDRVVKIDLECKDKFEVLEKVAEMLLSSGYVKESFIQGVIDREKIFPTGLPTGDYCVAIPHTDVIHVNTPMIAVATLKEAVEFNIMGGGEEDKVKVKIVFMLAMKDGNAQLALLQSLMDVIQDSELLRTIYETKEKSTLVNLLSKKLGDSMEL